MNTTENDIEITNDPYMTLREWSDLINGLIAEHGENAILFTASGYNNCEIMLRKL